MVVNDIYLKGINFRGSYFRDFAKNRENKGSRENSFREIAHF